MTAPERKDIRLAAEADGSRDRGRPGRPKALVAELCGLVAELTDLVLQHDRGVFAGSNVGAARRNRLRDRAQAIREAGEADASDT